MSMRHKPTLAEAQAVIKAGRYKRVGRGYQLKYRTLLRRLARQARFARRHPRAVVQFPVEYSDKELEEVKVDLQQKDTKPLSPRTNVGHTKTYPSPVKTQKTTVTPTKVSKVESSGRTRSDS